MSNIRIEELLRVEIYRRGLHSDAFQRDNLRPKGLRANKRARDMNITQYSPSPAEPT